MKIRLHKKFVKKLSKLKKQEALRCKKRLILFMEDPFHDALNNHALQGKYTGMRSINMSGDLRAVYELVGKGTAYFVDLDNHNNLYS